jgi:hypothetical protein
VNGLKGIIPFLTELRPLNAADADPDLSDNQAETTLDIERVVPNAIDVKPARIRLRSNGMISVLALNNKAGQHGLPLAFDASTIDSLSVRFGSYEHVWNNTGGASEVHQKGHHRERGIMLHFRALETSLTVKDKVVCLKGTWYDSNGNPYIFFGCDEVTVVGSDRD